VVEEFELESRLGVERLVGDDSSSLLRKNLASELLEDISSSIGSIGFRFLDEFFFLDLGIVLG
jgi:hypothetical protein